MKGSDGNGFAQSQLDERRFIDALDVAAVSKAIETVRERGGTCAARLGGKVVLLVELESTNAVSISWNRGQPAGAVYRFDLEPADAARLAAQLLWLVR